MSKAGAISSVLDVEQPEWQGRLLVTLGPLCPPRVRRAARARELVEALGRGSAQSARSIEGGADPRGAGLEMSEGFDPDHGASGRPGPIGEYVVGATKGFKPRRELRNSRQGKIFGSWVRLVDGAFEYGDAQDLDVFRLPIIAPGDPGQDRIRFGVAELVWFEAVTPLDPRSSYIFRDRTLLFLDGRGYRVAAIRNLGFSPDEVFRLARAAAVPAAAYRVQCLEHQTREIQNLMFPRPSRFRRR